MNKRDADKDQERMMLGFVIWAGAVIGFFVLFYYATGIDITTLHEILHVRIVK